MKYRAMVMGLAVAVCLTTCGYTQQFRPWWVGVELGEAQFKLRSDQVNGARGPTLTMGLVGGHRLGSRARVGLEVSGWLLQAFNLDDPTVGESVSNVLGIVDVFPIRKTTLFLRGGAGAAMYTNNRPTGSGGNGAAWTAGVGYEIPCGKGLGLAPIISYALGHVGEVQYPLSQAGRRYSAVEFKATLVYHFGKVK